MRAVRTSLLALAFALVAWPALAVNDWGYTGCANGATLFPYSRICFDFDTSLSPASTAFDVKAPSAIACLKTDVDQEGVSATGGTPATAIIRLCPYADTTAAANCGIQMSNQVSSTLTGANGTPSTQTACVALGPGVYRVDFPTLPDDPDVAIFSVEGGQ